MNFSDTLSSASLVITFVAAVIAVITLRKGNKNSSASTLVSLMDGFGAAWQRVMDASSEQKNYALNELFNYLELSSAVVLEGSLVGRPAKIARQYIFECIELIDNNLEVKTAFNDAKTHGSTFENIFQFKDRYPERPLK